MTSVWILADDFIRASEEGYGIVKATANGHSTMKCDATSVAIANRYSLREISKEYKVEVFITEYMSCRHSQQYPS